MYTLFTHIFHVKCVYIFLGHPVYIYIYRERERESVCVSKTYTHFKEGKCIRIVILNLYR